MNENKKNHIAKKNTTDQLFHQEILYRQNDETWDWKMAKAAMKVKHPIANLYKYAAGFILLTTIAFSWLFYDYTADVQSTQEYAQIIPVYDIEWYTSDFVDDANIDLLTSADLYPFEDE